MQQLLAIPSTGTRWAVARVSAGVPVPTVVLDCPSQAVAEREVARMRPAAPAEQRHPARFVETDQALLFE